MICRTFINVESRVIRNEYLLITSFMLSLFLNQAIIAQPDTEVFKARLFVRGEEYIPFEVGDELDHVMGVSEYSGLVFTENGEIATCYETSTFEQKNGRSISVGYWIFTFKDSSEMVIRFEGDGPIGKNTNPFWKGSFTYISGTGKYLGIQGSGTYNGEYFPDVNCGYNDLSGTYLLK